MSENNLHGSHHDFPEDHYRQPVQPISPDPMISFPPEFPYPDPSYTGPYVVINEIDSPMAPENGITSGHDGSHPTEPGEPDGASAAIIPDHNDNHPTGPAGGESYYLR